MADDKKAGGVRRRKTRETNDSGDKAVHKEMLKEKQVTENVQLKTGSYWLTRIVLLRAIGFVYSKLCLCRLLGLFTHLDLD